MLDASLLGAMMLGAMLMLAAIFKPPGRRTQAIGAGKTCAAKIWRPSARSGLWSRQPRGRARLQLAIPPQHIAAAVPDPEAMGHQRGAAAHHIAPGHAGTAIAKSFGGGPAGCQILHVDGCRKG